MIRNFWHKCSQHDISVAVQILASVLITYIRLNRYLLLYSSSGKEQLKQHINIEYLMIFQRLSFFIIWTAISQRQIGNLMKACDTQWTKILIRTATVIKNIIMVTTWQLVMEIGSLFLFQKIASWTNMNFVLSFWWRCSVFQLIILLTVTASMASEWGPTSRAHTPFIPNTLFSTTGWPSLLQVSLLCQRSKPSVATIPSFTVQHPSTDPGRYTIW